MADGIQKVNAGLKDMSTAADLAVAGLQGVQNSVLQTGKGMEGLHNLLKNTGNSLESLTRGLSNFSEAVPGLGLVGDAFSVLSGTLGMVSGAADILTNTFLNSVKATDSLSSVNRDLTRNNFELAAQFGRSLEEAERFTEFMIQSSDVLSKSDFGYQNMATESKEMVKALAQQRLSFEVMKETVTSTAGSFNLYSTAVLQAQALGLTYSEYASNMNSLILQQGMNVQQAAGTLSIFGNLAEETGLTVGKISEALNSLGNSFKKMGLDATFGESFLRGFHTALKDTGIGLDAVAEMTQVFGNRMASLSTNYGSAFITAMRGGLDVGSGGALGAGIQLQAQLMDPNVDQAELGKNIADAVRQSVASFTGGEIITVREAAESRDPRMEQAYYAQTQILKSLYGISDPQEQARTLELLQQISDAQISNDRDAIASIGEDLQKALNLRQSTISNEDKLNTMVAAQLGQLQSQTHLLRLIAAASQNIFVDSTAPFIENKLDDLFSNTGQIEKRLEEYMSQVRTGPSTSFLDSLSGTRGEEMLKKWKDEQEQIQQSRAKDFGEGIKDFFEWVKNGNVINVQSSELLRAIQNLPGELAKIMPTVHTGGKSKVNGIVGGD